MNKSASSSGLRRIEGRWAIGDAIDGRSREGKFLRKCEAELLAQVGGEPSFDTAPKRAAMWPETSHRPRQCLSSKLVSRAQIAARQCRKTRGRAGVKPLVASGKTRAMAILGAYLGALAIIATY